MRRSGCERDALILARPAIGHEADASEAEDAVQCKCMDCASRLRRCAPAAELNSAFTQVCHCLGGKAAREVQDDDGMSGEHSGDRGGATAWTRAAFAAIVLLLSLAAPVAAGPLEDAVAVS